MRDEYFVCVCVCKNRAPGNDSVVTLKLPDSMLGLEEGGGGG